MQTIVTPNPMDDVIVSTCIRHLDLDIYRELKQFKGQDVSAEDLKQSELRLQTIINGYLYRIGKHSLVMAGREVGILIPNSLELALFTDCRTRANFSAHSIIATTAQAIGVMYAALSKKKALGRDRSKSVANYEGPRIFFEQRTKGWRLKHGVRKAWYTGSGNVCDICTDNEDEGPIPMDEEFPSGDQFAPAHINCGCLVSLIF